MEENGLNINTRFRKSKSRQALKNKTRGEISVASQNNRSSFWHMNDRNLDVQKDRELKSAEKISRAPPPNDTRRDIMNKWLNEPQD